MLRIQPSEFLLKTILLLATVFTLLFYLADFFCVYYEMDSQGFIFLDERRIFLEQNLLIIFALVTWLLMTISIFLKVAYIKRFKNKDWFLLFVIIYFILYYILSGGILRGMFFLGVLCTFFLYGFFPYLIRSYNLDKTFKSVKKIMIYMSLFFLLTPLVVFLIHYAVTFEKYFQISFFPQLYIVDSFRGLTLDRVQYTFFSGITLLFILFEKKKVLCYRLMFCLLLLGLYLALARAGVLALIVAVSFYTIKSKKISSKTIFRCVFFDSLFVLAAFFILSMFNHRIDLFSDGGDRIFLLSSSIEKIFDNGIVSFLFGHGNFYIVSYGHQPHNSILQSMMNFGAIITLLWLLVLYNFYNALGLKGKTLFIYVFIFGLFHVGFSAFVFMPVTVFSYFCILVFNINDKRCVDDSSISQRILAK
ncbi:hypothetical protein [Marinomonas sp.]|uniref:hypothetical protein n=1 Tax=Marinomonas sp. TaxID=1904862 RepID=UPI003BAD2BBC